MVWAGLASSDGAYSVKLLEKPVLALRPISLFLNLEEPPLLLRLLLLLLLLLERLD